MAGKADKTLVLAAFVPDAAPGAGGEIRSGFGQFVPDVWVL